MIYKYHINVKKLHLFSYRYTMFYKVEKTVYCYFGVYKYLIDQSFMMYASGYQIFKHKQKPKKMVLYNYILYRNLIFK